MKIWSLRYVTSIAVLFRFSVQNITEIGSMWRPSAILNLKKL